MSGAHRRPPATVGETARKLTRRLAILAGWAAITVATIWLGLTGHFLILWGVVLALSLVALPWSLASRSPERIWTSAGMIIWAGWQVISLLTHESGNSLADDLIAGVFLLCVLVGKALEIWPNRLGWLRKIAGARLASGPGDGPSSPG
jgi:hypothetical protein